MDRRGSINYFNQKYGRANTSVVTSGPSTFVTNVAPGTLISEKRTITTVDPVATATPVEVHQSDIATAQVHTKNTTQGGGRICGCPWWLCVVLSLLGLILLGLILGFITGFFGNKASVAVNEGVSNTDGTVQESGEVNGGTPEQGCNSGFFVHDGKCIRCPEGSNWNGENCVRNPVSHILRQ